MAENNNKINKHIHYNRSAVDPKNTTRKEFRKAELEALAQKNYFDVYPECKEVFASGFGQFFFSAAALKTATKEESSNFLRIAIKRSK